MYILIVGGGKVGSNLTAALLKMGHEVSLLDNDRERYALLEEKFEHVARYGDATELYVLERAGVERVVVRVMDPARSDWYREQGLNTISPTKVAIAEFNAALEQVS